MRVMFQSSAVNSSFSLESVVNIKHCCLFIAFRSQDIGNWLSISFRQIGVLFHSQIWLLYCIYYSRIYVLFWGNRNFSTTPMNFEFSYKSLTLPTSVNRPIIAAVLISPQVLILKYIPNLPSLEKSLGTNWTFRQCCGLQTTIFYCWTRRQGWWLCWKKKTKFSSKSNPGERRLWRREFTSAIYHEFS